LLAGRPRALTSSHARITRPDAGTRQRAAPSGRGPVGRDGRSQRLTVSIARR
jgi:hypothetical protein